MKVSYFKFASRIPRSAFALTLFLSSSIVTWAEPTRCACCTIYAGTDDLGRSLPIPEEGATTEYNPDKSVGILYFVWHGLNGRSGPYDISKIVAKYPDALQNTKRWGPLYAYHWWGEPLFGYFVATDEWVLLRDVMMLTDAGYDFIVIDESNDSFYPQSTSKLLRILYKYHEQGWRVPQVAFLTKAHSVRKMALIYDTYYRPHPEYKDLWFRIDGRPLIIGNNRSHAIRSDVKEYFTIRWAQWPREPKRDDGFPWISFERPPHVYGKSLGKTVMSVSVAQHCGSFAFSTSAFYGDPNNCTRSYHDGKNDSRPKAYLYGYNFAEEFEYAIRANVDIVLVTGWNEWIARRLQLNVITRDKNYPYQGPIWFIDEADINNSRDIQPMKGGYGDNYYMQAIILNRKFKGARPTNIRLDKAFTCKNKTIHIDGDWAQWDDIDNLYLDYVNDTIPRHSPGYGSLFYINTTGRNDLTTMKVTHDSRNLYFYAETARRLTPPTGKHWMNLFIDTGKSSKSWYGYEFVVNRIHPGVVERCAGGRHWRRVATIPIRWGDNRIHLAVPFDVLGIRRGTTFRIQFKWADNYRGEGNIWSFYLDGDSAPYGRLNYVYCGKR